MNPHAVNSKITNDNEASAMLLYEAPFGIAVFSFDAVNSSLKCLEEFIKCEKVSSPFGPTNVAIDDNLAGRLIRLCGSKKLVVGSAQHKAIIEEKLGITCLCVDVPDCEVIQYNPKNHVGTLLPEEKSKTGKRDFDGELLIKFLRQHDFDVKPELVSESIAELARLLLDVELCEMEHLKFLCILLKDFIVKSGIDTKKWRLFHFATVLKMICYPGSSYQIYPPNKIFSREVYRKIQANASPYKENFSKIDALSVYEDVVSLYSKKCLLLADMDCLVEEATAVLEKQTENVENKQAGNTGNEGIPATSEITTASTSNPLSSDVFKKQTENVENKQAGDTGNKGIPATSDITTASTSNPLSSDISNSLQFKGDDGKVRNVAEISEITSVDEEEKKAKTASGEKPQSGRLVSDLVCEKPQSDAHDASPTHPKVYQPWM